MKKTVSKRKDIAKKLLGFCVFGAPAGLALQMLFWLWASWLRGDGEFHFVSWHLIGIYGTELNAVTAQCICAMLLGMLWASATMIFQDTDWSILKQTVIHFLVCTVPALLIAMGMGFMPRSVDGLTQYLRIFGFIYAVNWVMQYLRLRKRVTQINAQLRRMQGDT